MTDVETDAMMAVGMVARWVELLAATKAALMELMWEMLLLECPLAALMAFLTAAPRAEWMAGKMV